MILNLLQYPHTPQDLAIFSFANADHHLQVFNAIYAKNGLRTTQYALDPIPSFDFKNWLLRHQDVHNSVNAALGVAGQDLTEVNMNDPKSVEDFLWQHQSEHYQWASKLGVF